MLAPNIVQLIAVVEIVVIVHGLAVLGWDNVGTCNPRQSCAHQVSKLVAGSDNTAGSLVALLAGFKMDTVEKWSTQSKRTAGKKACTRLFTKRPPPSPLLRLL